MGYHPETLAFSFPPHPRGGTWGLRKDGTHGDLPWSFGRWLYSLKPWIGFDVWHIDPERPGTANRADDSCGWFPRDLTPPIQNAVDQFMSACHEGDRLMIEAAILRRAPYDARYPSLKRMPVGEGYALAIMVLTFIDRWSLQPKRAWRRRSEWKAQLRILRLAERATLNSIDNVLEAETVESFVKWLARIYRRDIRPWWQHPRWHVHHWKINFDIARNVKRMFQRCATCRKPLGFGCSPLSDDRGLHHMNCAHVHGPAEARA